jgi:hypothetical protein
MVELVGKSDEAIFGSEKDFPMVKYQNGKTLK